MHVLTGSGDLGGLSAHIARASALERFSRSIACADLDEIESDVFGRLREPPPEIDVQNANAEKHEKDYGSNR